jgi:predicted enzyme related to lactoylglutathione lyase
MADNTVRGRFVWHELMTPNAAGAHDFYSKVFGWTKQAWEHNPSYSMFSGPKGPLGATVEAREGTPQWVPYIATVDVDATVAAAQGLGAAVKTPTTAIPNAGTHAVLADPQGGIFGVHSSSSPAAPEAPAEAGEFFWHELATTAPADEAAAFYTQLFGWDLMARHDMGPPTGIYLIFGRNGKQLGGIFNKGDANSAYWVGYVRVQDIAATVDKVKDARGGLLNGPMDVPGGDKIAQFSDPHGAFFAAHMQGGELAVAAKPAKAVKPAKPPKPAAAAKPAKPAEAAKPAKPAAAAKPAAPAKPAKPPVKKKVKKVAKKKVKKKARKAAKKVAKKVGKKAKKAGKKKAAKKKAVKRTAGKKSATRKKAANKKTKRGAAKKPAKIGRKARHGGDAHLR